ncbi:transglycosylase SLT domain-containing protein [Acidimangrovimonas sediminis]|uniref:transglycosylase SLT domain-containing protein n=1 Tax=Acidimangrovimonas sediminis TaxID=2056283 RepID=UPI001E3EFBE5|nr:transglycosylase SLT domain-containing protein [Acidimangrovimonas sediminis]
MNVTRRRMRQTRHFLSPLRGGVGVIAVTLACLVSRHAGAQDLPALCETAARRASHETGVPVAVLQAISLTETGRRRGGTTRPWPWTVNMEGKGVWFPTRGAALDYVKQSYAAGARSFDLGCFQLNHRWHGKAFADFDAMFDPEANALYAARFLKSLYDETGDWTKAAGAYHSRTPEHARRYAEIFRKHLARVIDAPPAAPAIAATAPRPVQLAAAEDPHPPRVNAFPLLQAGDTAGLGSLVPLGAGGRSLFADPQG